MHFYELHEGDNDAFADLLLVREDEMEPEEFFDVVQSIRRRIQDSYERETLIEAIADELERDYDFIAVSDDRLTAAINVSQGRGRQLHRRPRGARARDRLRVDPGRPPGGRQPPQLTPSRAGGPTAAAGYSAEQDLDDVPVADAVGPALGADLAVLLRLGDRAQRRAGPRSRSSRRG